EADDGLREVPGRRLARRRARRRAAAHAVAGDDEELPGTVRDDAAPRLPDAAAVPARARRRPHRLDLALRRDADDPAPVRQPVAMASERGVHDAVEQEQAGALELEFSVERDR